MPLPGVMFIRGLEIWLTTVRALFAQNRVSPVVNITKILLNGSYMIIHTLSCKSHVYIHRFTYISCP